MVGTKTSGKKKKPVQASKLKAQGKTTKRTPSGAFDPAAGKEIYEPVKIIAERLAKGVTQFMVKWAGYSDKDNTWEPIEHLAGCEDMIAEFKDRENVRIAQLDAAAEAKRIEKQEAEAKANAEAAAAAAAARLQAGPSGVAAVATPEPATAHGPAKKTRRSSPWWAFFDESGCAEGSACCTLNKKDGTLCGESISVQYGPTGMRNHINYLHPDTYVQVSQQMTEQAADSGESGPQQKQVKLPAVPAKTRDALHLAHSRWPCKKKRPLSLPEDREYRDLWELATHGQLVNVLESGVVAGAGDPLATAGHHGQAVPRGAGIDGRGGARLLRSRQDA